MMQTPRELFSLEVVMIRLIGYLSTSSTGYNSITKYLYFVDLGVVVSSVICF